MSHKITIDVPDDLYLPIEEAARRSGSRVEHVIVEKLRATEGETLASVTNEASEAKGLGVLLKYAGCVSSFHPSGADNEAIDEDLAREYGSSHDEEE
jgi:hypothetical protein